MQGTLLNWTERIDRMPIAVRVAFAVTALGTVTLIDRATGPDLVLTFTYALCVMAAAWFISREWGLVAAAAATVGGLAVDITSERDEDWLVLIANHTLRAVSYVLFALLVSSVRRSIADLVDTTRIDQMTGILNRQGFHDELAAARRRALRHGAPIGVVYLDLDGLKRVNDVEGHAAGDALIRRFVGRVERHLRNTDAFGRLGGDEFAIELERADAAVIDAVVGRILDDPGLPSASCGVQVFEGDYPSPNAMLAGADRQMYHDKRSRRGIEPSP